MKIVQAIIIAVIAISSYGLGYKNGGDDFLIDFAKVAEHYLNAEPEIRAKLDSLSWDEKVSLVNKMPDSLFSISRQR